MRIRHAFAIGLATWAAACSARPAIVPVRGGPADVAALAGEWSGTYESLEGRRRSGDIMFQLREGRDTAVGYVIMTFLSDSPRRRPSGYPAPPIQLSEQLSIAFVRAEGGRVTGQLEPYVDPYCGCRLRTTFVGRLRGNRIEGTFRSEHLESGAITTGEWRVTRRRAIAYK